MTANNYKNLSIGVILFTLVLMSFITLILSLQKKDIISISAPESLFNGILQGIVAFFILNILFVVTTTLRLFTNKEDRRDLSYATLIGVANIFIILIFCIIDLCILFEGYRG